MFSFPVLQSYASKSVRSQLIVLLFLCGLMARISATEINRTIPLQIQEQRIPRQMTRTATGIQGDVRNKAKLSIGGVRVTLYAADGSQKAQAITAGDGIFRMLDLPPGEYELQVDAQGFQSFREQQ